MSDRSLISGATKFVGVVGDPIKHSLSPLIHNHWLKKYNIDAVYIPFHVKSEHLLSFLNGLKNTNCIGLNITVPHKQDIFKHTNYASNSVSVLGAANTVVFNQQKYPNSYFTDNTDAVGFISALPHCNFDKVVVIGAGGAARAVCYALKTAGVQKFVIANRTLENSQYMVEDLEVDAELITIDYIDKYINDAELIVNTTTLGMNNMSKLAIDLSNAPENCTVYDLIYNPEKTELLKQAETRNLLVINGSKMLVGQAQQSFNLWFNILPDFDAELRDKLKIAL